MTHQTNDNSDRSVTLTVKGLMRRRTATDSIRTITVPYSAFSRTLQWIQRQGGQILQIDIQSSPFPSQKESFLSTVESETKRDEVTNLAENKPDNSQLPEEAINSAPSQSPIPSPHCASRLLSLNLDTEAFISLSSRRNRRRIRNNRQKISPVNAPLHRRRRRRK